MEETTRMAAEIHSPQMAMCVIGIIQIKHSTNHANYKGKFSEFNVLIIPSAEQCIQKSYCGG